VPRFVRSALKVDQSHYDVHRGAAVDIEQLTASPMMLDPGALTHRSGLVIPLMLLEPDL